MNYWIVPPSCGVIAIPVHEKRFSHELDEFSVWDVLDRH